MAITTEPIVTELKADTSDFERKSQQVQQRFGQSSQAMARDALGFARSVEDFSKRGIQGIGALAFDVSQLGESVGRMSTKWASLLGGIGTAAAWAAAAAGIASVVVELSGVRNEIERMRARSREATRTTEEMMTIDELVALSAGIEPVAKPKEPSWMEAVRKTGTRTLEDLDRMAEAGRQRNAQRTAAALEAQRQMDALLTQATAARGPRLGTFEGLFPEVGAEQEAAQRLRDEQQQAFVERQIEFTRQVMAEYETLGIDPELGLMGFALGKEESVARALERFDFAAAKSAQTMQQLGQIAKGSAAAGFQAFFATLYAGRGAAAAFAEMAKAIIQTIAQQALVKASWEFAEAIASSATGDAAGASLHWSAMAKYLAVSAIAGTIGAMAGAGGGGGGGGGRGGGGGGTPLGGEAFGPAGAGGGGGPLVMNISVSAPPGAEAAAGEAIVMAIRRYERERANRVLL